MRCFFRGQSVTQNDYHDWHFDDTVDVGMVAVADLEEK